VQYEDNHGGVYLAAPGPRSRVNIAGSWRGRRHGIATRVGLAPVLPSLFAKICAAGRELLAGDLFLLLGRAEDQTEAEEAEENTPSFAETAACLVDERAS
jgi:hypothetical protein